MGEFGFERHTQKQHNHVLRWVVSQVKKDRCVERVRNVGK